MSDVEAETFAAESREQGAALVRRHLENHSRNNPGRSSDYVTVGKSGCDQKSGSCDHDTVSLIFF